MFLAVVRDPLANDEAGIADRSGHRQNFEVALGKIAQRVEIKHLAVRVKERALRVVTRGGGSDDHSGGVVTLPSDAVGRAGRPTERSQIGDAVT